MSDTDSTRIYWPAEHSQPDQVEPQREEVPPHASPEPKQ